MMPTIYPLECQFTDQQDDIHLCDDFFKSLRCVPIVFKCVLLQK